MKTSGSGSEMPATMMLGIEDFYRIIVGAIIYTAFAKQLVPLDEGPGMGTDNGVGLAEGLAESEEFRRG